MLRKVFFVIFLALFLSACQTKPISPLAEDVIVNEDMDKKITDTAQKSDIIVTLNTSMGEIILKLYPQKAPLTVKNFVELAKGEKEWLDPRTNKKSSNPLYKNLVFHRVIKDFMIQGGDPLGNGTGGPGYKFADEFDASLSFDKVGILAMANSGPNTNGSQFFITLAPTPWLNGKHTIFGQVVSGLDVLKKIGNVKTDQQDRPIEDVVLQSIDVGS